VGYILLLLGKIVPKERGYGREDAGFETLSILSPEKSGSSFSLKKF
jgi:hypothetical protein